TPQELSKLLPTLTDDPAVEVVAAIIKGLSVGSSANKAIALTPEAEKAVGELLVKLPASSRGRLIKLASVWGVKGLDAQLVELTKSLFVTVAKADAADADRI